MKRQRKNDNEQRKPPSSEQAYYKHVNTLEHETDSIHHKGLGSSCIKKRDARCQICGKEGFYNEGFKMNWCWQTAQQAVVQKHQEFYNI